MQCCHRYDDVQIPGPVDLSVRGIMCVGGATPLEVEHSLSLAVEGIMWI